MGRLGRVLSPLAAAVVWSSAAWAQSDQDKGLATVLFDDARALLAQDKVSEACRKLEESRRLDPLPGTLINLAACHDREGLTASAMAEFREARALAERDHRDDRVALADEHLKALEPRLSILVIAIAQGADRPDLGVTRDGVALGRAAWGTRIPVDPGTHVIEAFAPGKVRRRIEVRVGGNGDVQTATLAPLEDEPPPSIPAPPVVAPPPPAPAVHVEPPPPRASLSTRRTVALVTGAAGLVGIGLGSYFGLTAISKHDSPDATCPGPTNNCSAQITLNHQAGFNADASTVSFVVGLAALGVGAFLWFGDSQVTVSSGVGSLAVSGRF